MIFLAPLTLLLHLLLNRRILARRAFSAVPTKHYRFLPFFCPHSLSCNLSPLIALPILSVLRGCSASLFRRLFQFDSTSFAHETSLSAKPKPSARFDLLRQGLRAFLHTKSKLSARHEFALATLAENAAWVRVYHVDCIHVTVGCATHSCV